MIQILFVFLCYTALLALGKVVFVLYVGGYTFAETIQVMAHGLPMDMTMAGYLTVVPALLTIALLWTDPHWKQAPAWTLCPPRSGAVPTKTTAILRIAVKTYFWISSALITFGVVLNACLYCVASSKKTKSLNSANSLRSSQPKTGKVSKNLCRKATYRTKN